MVPCDIPDEEEEEEVPSVSAGKLMVIFRDEVGLIMNFEPRETRNSDHYTET